MTDVTDVNTTVTDAPTTPALEGDSLAMALLDPQDATTEGAEGQEPAEPTEGHPAPAEGQESAEGQEPAEGEDKPKEAAEDKPKDPLTERRSRVIAELATKELAIREQQEALSRQRLEIQKAEQAIAQHNDLVALAKSDPLAYLERSGINVNDLTRRILNSDTKDPNEAKLAALEAKLEAFETGQKQATSHAAEQRIAQAIVEEKTSLASFVKEQAKSYPLLSSLEDNEVAEGMFEVRRQHWQKTKTQLDAAQAAQDIEGKLEAYYQRLSQAASKKSDTAGATTGDATAQQATTGASSTLNAQSMGSLTAKNPNDLSDQEREALALELLGQIPER